MALRRHVRGRALVVVGGGGYGVVNVAAKLDAPAGHRSGPRDVDVDTKVGDDWYMQAATVATEVHPDYARAPEQSMGDGGNVDYVAWDGDTGQEPPEGISGRTATDRSWNPRHQACRLPYMDSTWRTRVTDQSATDPHSQPEQAATADAPDQVPVFATRRPGPSYGSSGSPNVTLPNL